MKQIGLFATKTVFAISIIIAHATLESSTRYSLTHISTVPEAEAMQNFIRQEYKKKNVNTLSWGLVLHEFFDPKDVLDKDCLYKFWKISPYGKEEQVSAYMYGCLTGKKSPACIMKYIDTKSPLPLNNKECVEIYQKIEQAMVKK